MQYLFISGVVTICVSVFLLALYFVKGTKDKIVEDKLAAYQNTIINSIDYHSSVLYDQELGSIVRRKQILIEKVIDDLIYESQNFKDKEVAILYDCSDEELKQYILKFVNLIPVKESNINNLSEPVKKKEDSGTKNILNEINNFYNDEEQEEE